MKIPSDTKIGGHIYEVKYPYVFKERFDHLGQIDHQQCKILITDGDSGGKRANSAVLETFIHEVLHALNYRAGDILFSKDIDTQEDQISALSEGILALLVDNGWVDIESC